MQVNLGVWRDISPYPFVSVAEADGHSGHGFYAWETAHPENGAHFFDHMPTWQELYDAGYPMFEQCAEEHRDESI